jgi:SM-20-related protein
MYLEDERVYDVAPQAGTLMVFMSAQWPHEVLPATRDRLSITGWFRRRA